MMIMKILISLLLSCLSICHGAPQPPRQLEENQLKSLSAEGERYINEEVKKALLGVKQMKETMDKTEEKHQQLIKTLKQSHDKKRGAEQLALEAEQKLQEAEQQCHDKLRPMWNQCRPCLQASCGSFYTSTCRRSSSFSLQVEEFGRRMASKLGEDQDQIFSQSPDIQLKIQNQTHMPMDQNTPEYQEHGDTQHKQLLEISLPSNMDKDLNWIKNTFSHIKTKVASLYSQTSALVTAMQQELGSAFLSAFTEDVQPSLPSEHLQTGGLALSRGLSGAFGSFLEMGRSVLHEVSSALTQVFESSEEDAATQRGWLSSPGQLCRNLRSRGSECKQPQSDCDNCHQALLTECPEVPDHYSELSEISLLLNASRNQYEEVLQVLRTHTKHTIRWAENMTRMHAWVTHISNGTAPPHIFSLVKIVPGTSGQIGAFSKDTVVEVSVLDSSVLSLSVPADLELTSPAFIQHIAKEALVAYQNTLVNELHLCEGGFAHPVPHD